MTRIALVTVARRTAAAALLALALFAGASTAATPASARMKGPVFDSFSAACLDIQNTTDALIAEYNNPNTTPARRSQIGDERIANARLWVQIGCFGVFGPIVRVSLPDAGVHVADGGSAGVLASEPTPAPGRFPGAVGVKPVSAKG